jgi:putative transcriptional regulator
LARKLQLKVTAFFRTVTLAEQFPTSMNRLPTAPQYRLSGQLVVASPHWNDPLFNQAVCLVVHHSEQGAVGVLLNKLINVDASSFWLQVGAADSGSGREILYLGGPHSGPVVAMHQRKDLAEFTSGEGVYFAAQVDAMKRLVADNNCQCRFIVGQATWEAGQLDRQFAEGCWLPQPVKSEVVFEDADRMWFVALKEAGNLMVQSLIGKAIVPRNIERN